ncbi:MAG: hypothetical protein J5755_00450, partial [Clostridia bacterium]|nr:hypothetical protein [Clostridia bacterium]
CSPKGQTSSFAWIERSADVPHGASEVTVIPQGEELAGLWTYRGETLGWVTRLVEDGPQVDEDVYFYRVYSADGTLLLDGKTDVLLDGVFAWTSEVDEDGNVIEKVYDCTGKQLFESYASTSIAALDGTYVAVYGDDWSQVMDREGASYLSEGAMDPNESYAVCDRWLLSHSALDNTYMIWELDKRGDRGSAVLLKRYSAADTAYSVAYLGNGRFWVVSTVRGGAHPTYIETVDGTEYPLTQTSVVFDAVHGSSDAFGRQIVLGLTNAYTPYLLFEERNALPFGQGYTAVNTAIVEEGKRVGSRYVVVDNATGKQVAAFPYDSAPLSIAYRDGYLFKGAGESGYQVGLYSADGTLLWRNGDHSYQNIKFGYSRLICAYLEEGTLRYGAFDAAGQVAVPFVYAYLSPYSDYLALAYQAGNYSIIDQSGVAQRSIDPVPDYPTWELGAYLEGDVLYNFQGDVILRGVSDLTVTQDSERMPILMGKQEGSTRVWRIIYG